jgi:3-deoxy-D-arabino-heptulosonate 7-phosphate (DAHP) synthase
MSHKMKATVKLYDLDLIKNVLDELEIAYSEDTEWHGWYSSQTEHVDVLVKESGMHYGVGFKQDAEGNLEIITESMGTYAAGDVRKRFLRDYQIAAASQQFAAHGYRLERMPNGHWKARSTARTASAVSRRRHSQDQTRQKIGRY